MKSVIRPTLQEGLLAHKVLLIIWENAIKGTCSMTGQSKICVETLFVFWSQKPPVINWCDSSCGQVCWHCQWAPTLVARSWPPAPLPPWWPLGLWAMLSRALCHAGLHHGTIRLLQARTLRASGHYSTWPLKVSRELVRSGRRCLDTVIQTLASDIALFYSTPPHP